VPDRIASDLPPSPAVEDTPANSCVAPASTEPDVCQPRVRRRLLVVGRPAARANPETDAVVQAARRMTVRVAHQPDVGAAVDYLATNAAACVVLDATDPRVDAMEAVARLSATRYDAPVVVIGHEQDATRAVAVVSAGAQDYVLESGLEAAALERVIRQAIDRHRSRVQLQRLAMHDQLTGVANRSLFHERLDAALRRQSVTGRQVAVVFVDIDGFKRINDGLGHGAGDRALRAAAERMTAAIRPGDTLARIGGDEFTVLCEDIPDHPSALHIAERITRELETPLAIDGAEVVLRASVGVAVASAGCTGDDLLRDADHAMYEAKRHGGGRAELFIAGHQATGSDIRLEAELRRGIPDQLRAVYQPQVRLTDGALLGIEALARWEHPERGIVPPGEFIPVAEMSGLILPIGRWMLMEACAEAMRLGDREGRRPRVSVNVSARQVADPGLVTDVELALARSGLAPEQLQLELTESILIQDLDAGLVLVERLKDLGVSLALDDFGTGYSSLSYLKQLPFDVVKIDRSFVSGLPGCREDLAIVSAVISFAGALGMDVLAEGVETEAHVDALLELGCDHAQGFHFYRPLDAVSLRELWRS
jgi:diguanylate cyclase (GGDEF)-like protein